MNRTRKRAPMPKPKVRAGTKAAGPQAPIPKAAGPTKSRVQPAVSRKNRAGPKPAPKPASKPVPKPTPKPASKPVPKPMPKPLPTPRARTRPVPRQKQRPKPVQVTIAENASLREWLSVQREKEQKTIEAQAALAKEVQNRYQAQVDAELRDFAARSMIAYRIKQDPRQRKANDVMREEDPEHVDTIYTEQDLKDIEEMFGPFTYEDETKVQNTRMNPIQLQSLKERLSQARKQSVKRKGTLKARKHAGQGTGF